MLAITANQVIRLSRRQGSVPLLTGTFRFHDGPGPHALLSGSDGGIRVLDPAGGLQLGPRPVTYRHVAWSRDGQRMVATTEQGALLSWDLGQLGAQRITLDVLAPLALSASAFWYLDEGVYRFELANQTSRRVAEFLRFGTSLTPDERWLVGAEPEGYRMFDLVRRVDRPVLGVFALAGDGVVVIGSDGVARGYDAAHPDGDALGLLIPDPAFAIASTSWVVAIDERGTMVRLDRATRARTRAQLRAVPELALLDDRGDAWLVIGGALWRWDGRGAPVEVPTARPVRALANAGGVLAHCGSGLFRVDVTPPRTISMAVERFTVTPDFVAVESAQRAVEIIDLATGLSFPLPHHGRAKIAMLAHGRMLYLDDAPAATLWRFDLPTDEHGLRRWLDTVTNARPVAGSDMLVWP